MNNSNTNFYRIPLLGFAALIIAGSSIPGQSLPTVFKLTPDKLIHTVEYFILGYLIVRWMFVEFSEKSNTWKFSLTAILGGLFGVADELYQSLIPGRFTDPFDWMMDFTGVCLAILIYHFINRKRKRELSK